MLKEHLYDWGGLNQSIFLYLNKTLSLLNLDQPVLILDKIASYRNYFFFIILVIVCKIYFVGKHWLDQEKFSINLQKWSEILYISIVSFILNVAVNIIFKKSFEFVRPVCDQTLVDVYQVKGLHYFNCFLSFPSGHTMIATVMVSSFWPLLNKYGKFLGIVFIFATALSRITAGVHFPADLFYSFIITWSVTHLIRKTTLGYFRKAYHKVKDKFHEIKKSSKKVQS